MFVFDSVKSYDPGDKDWLSNKEYEAGKSRLFLVKALLHSAIQAPQPKRSHPLRVPTWSPLTTSMKGYHKFSQATV